MNHIEEVVSMTLSKPLIFSGRRSVELELASLIEAAEILRRNKIEPDKSYGETFFLAAKEFLKK